MTKDNLDFDYYDYEIKESKSDDNSEPLTRYQINSYSVDRAIETLIKWRENGKLIIPDFQRNFVWSFNNSSRLIDSILLSLPIPNIFVFKVIENGNDKYILVDGMQRITTIEQFRNCKWEQNGKKPKEFKISTKSSNWYGKTFETLSEQDKEFFLDYQLSVVIFETYGSEKYKENDAIYSVFERINTGSEKLSDQEIRNVVYDGMCLREIKIACKNKFYKSLIDNDVKINKRDKEIEFFLRVLTYNLVYKQKINGKNHLIDFIGDSKIVNSKTIMLNNYLKYSNDNMINYIEDIEDVKNAINIIYNIDPNAFYNIKKEKDELGKRVHEIFAESLILAVIDNNFKINIDPNCFIINKKKVWSNIEFFYKTFSEKTTDPNSVVKRVELMKAFINGSDIWK